LTCIFSEQHTFSVSHAVKENPRRLSVSTSLDKCHVVTSFDADDRKQFHLFAQWFQIDDGCSCLTLAMLTCGRRSRKPLVVGVLGQTRRLVTATLVATVALQMLQLTI